LRVCIDEAVRPIRHLKTDQIDINAHHTPPPTQSEIMSMALPPRRSAAPDRHALPELRFDARRYFGASHLTRITDEIEIELADRAYLPDLTDLRRDWVASVAAPAFRQLARNRTTRPRAFASIGTGSGVDALAAIEILDAEAVGITDLFEEVVAAAACNVRRNLRPGVAISLHAGAGDLLVPLASSGMKFDVIYENLPNLPVDDTRLIEQDKTSAAFLAPRGEAVPGFVADWLLTMHYLALVQARDALAPNGVVLSTVGARLPLEVLARMSRAAGLAPRVLTYGWKVQADADDVISTYANWERQGLGPFRFYAADALEATFADLDPGKAGDSAADIEASLAGEQFGAVAAWEAYRNGTRIGHTYVVLQSGLK
jgi:methylase of polypeptide subunit release factors